MRIRLSLVIVLLTTTCAQQSSQSLEGSLVGISKASFLACSGPPILETPQGGQDRMSFITNLTRGQPIGIGLDKTMPQESCSVDTVFANDRLVRANFSGNLTMCDRVFSPCRQP